MKKRILGISAIVATVAILSIVAFQIYSKRPKDVYVDPFAGVSEQDAEVVKSTSVSKTKVNMVNENIYEFTVDPEKNEADIDGKSQKLSDLLGSSEQEIKNLSSKKLLINYLKYHLIGNISESDDGKISVKNPYSTDALIVKGGNENELRSQKDVSEVKPVADGYYVVRYTSAPKTKAGYANLLGSNKIDGVVTDARVEISEGKIGEIKTQNNKFGDVKSTAATKAAASGYEAWGVESMGANHYTIKLSMAGHDREVRVAVLDTGINATHDVFTDEQASDRLDMTYAHDYVNDDDDPTDDNGHGTEVAGVVVESTPTNVKVVPVKVMNEEGKGDFSNIIVAAREIAEHVDVINMSLGLTEDEDTAAAVTYFNEILATIDPASTIMVASSGNESASASCFPASSPSVWSIGAVDSSNVVADFSNHDDNVDFSAPGVDLKLPHYSGNNTYAVDVSGTSFSSPFVAAAAAMIKVENPDYSASDVYAVLQANAVDLGEAGKDEYYGHGSIDFDSNMFKNPVFATAVPDQGWSIDSNIVTVGVVGDSAIQYGGATDSDEEPSNWVDLQNTEDYAIFNFQVAANGTYHAWAKDADGDIGSIEVTTDHIDTTAPELATPISRSTASNNTLTVEAAVKDIESGISSVAWTITDPETSTSKTETDTHGDTDSGRSGSEVSVKHTFGDLTAEKEYTVSAVVSDLVGNTLSIPAVTVRTGTVPVNPAVSDIKINVTTAVSLALLDPSDPSKEMDTVSMQTSPNNQMVTSSILARTAGNADYSVTIEMVGAETALVNGDYKVVGTTSDGVTAETMAPGSWGFSIDATNFSKVPAFGQSRTIKSVVPESDYDDTLVTFGAKAGVSTRSGNYTGSAIITVVANQ